MRSTNATRRCAIWSAHGPAAPIDLVLREVGDAQQQIAKLAATLVSTGAAAPASGGIDPLLALKADAARQPQPLGRWLTEIAASAIALRSGDPRLQLATIFNASGGPAELCPAVVNGHYPFAPSCDRRCAARRLRAAVRAGRRVRRLREHAAAALCRYVGQDRGGCCPPMPHRRRCRPRISHSSSAPRRFAMRSSPMAERGRASGWTSRRSAPMRRRGR